MWDARFDSIRDRKLNELVIFSAMIRTDPSKRREYVDIIQHLARDLDVIDALQADLPVPHSEPIMSKIYRGRLSRYESLDEYVLDECRKAVREMINPPERIASPQRLPSAEERKRIEPPVAQQSIEPPEIPKRIEPPVAAQSLNAPEVPQRIEPPVAQQSIEPPEIPQRLEAPDEPGKIDAPQEAAKLEAPEESHKLEAPEETAKIEPPEEPVKLDAPAEPEKIDAPVDPDETFDLVVSVEDAVTLKKVREMKDAKIDYFIDEEMSGHTKDDVCEEIISFLKTDIALIDRILAIDITSKESIFKGFQGIVDFVNAADEPSYQKVYLNALNLSEKALEGEYNNVLWRLEKAIIARHPGLIGGDGSVFFQEDGQPSDQRSPSMGRRRTKVIYCSRVELSWKTNLSRR
jgi:hypothetical protein